MAPVRVRAFAWAIGLLAALTIGVSSRLWPAHPGDWNITWVVLLVEAAVALHFPLNVSPKLKINLAPAAYFAALLLFGPTDAIFLVVLSRFLGEATLALRRDPLTARRRREMLSLLFNTGQHVLAVSAAALVLFITLPRTAPVDLGRPVDFIALPASAAVLFIFDSAVVGLMVAVAQGRNPIHIWRRMGSLDVVQSSALYLLGIIAAASSRHTAWAPAFIALPAVLLYLSMRRTLNVSVSTQVVDAVEAMADTVDGRDARTAGHSKRVERLAIRLGSRVGMLPPDLESIRRAARVHDIGKMGIPDNVLLKSGALDPDEARQLARYPEIGYDVLGRFSEYERARNLVLRHRERVDGLGYPDRLEGVAIPLAAQVVGLADAIDSLLSDRPYRLALPIDDVIAQLLDERDRCWSRSLVDAAVAELQEFGAELAAATPSAQTAVTKLGGQAVETIAVSLAALDRRLHELDRQVNTDDLTGVLRRGAGISRLDGSINEARREQRPLSLVFVDVDGLKGTNDTAGHAVGDAVLLRVASTLTDAVAPDGFVFRYGGDEFVCVLPGRTETETAAMFESLQANYSEQFGGSFSAGFAGLKGEDSGSEVIGRADLDLYNRRRFAAPYVMRPKDAASDPDSAKRAI